LAVDSAVLAAVAPGPVVKAALLEALVKWAEEVLAHFRR
jgi:hypothetical protein